ncbi:MAG: S-adenosylmethionine:tRNA ribosyltransferase-isomerase [Bacteroidota bacterium]|nr:S-adenosylmethionine:tRNA ribosyltransferase-isomerase [Bacteroidota bacterium]
MEHPRDLSIEAFSYDLPEERIAKYPLPKRDSSKLLIYQEGAIHHSIFRELDKNVPEGSMLVMNDTKVVRARLIFPRGEGRRAIEVFCLEPTHGMDVQVAMGKKGDLEFNCLVGGAKKWKEDALFMPLPAEGIRLGVEKLSRNDENFTLRFFWEGDLTFAEILEIAGRTPIPPYLKRESEEGDIARYQTVYARYDGSVAAPTAGLHFTSEVMERLREKGIQTQHVTLHVGAGTFKPVSSEKLEGHDMHFEEIHVKRDVVRSILEHSGAIISVGTTSTRTLETLYWLGVNALEGKPLERLHQWEPYQKEELPTKVQALTALLEYMDDRGLGSISSKTQLMIAPGYEYRVIDGLITNFHQPKSTLMLLVAAAIGVDWKKVYHYALSNEFRFLSYGDSSLLMIPKSKKV